MIKIIHTADIHLGSKMEAAFSDEKSAQRKQEVRLSFKKMVDYAVNNDVKVIMLCGDVFDSDLPLKKDKEFFIKIVEQNPNVDFLYLRGNHDSAPLSDALPPNLKTFNDTWTSYRYGDTVITGMESSARNCLSMYNELNLAPQDANLVMLHGQISATMGQDKIAIRKLAGKNIDYLALGHVHKGSEGEIDHRGIYRYCGCLEGRGFDDVGEKGFYLLCVQDGKIQSSFIPNSVRKILAFNVDISSATDSFYASNIVRSAINASPNDIIRVYLTGEVDFYDPFLASDVQSYLEGDYYVLSVKDKTEIKIDFNRLTEGVSLKSEFLKEILNDDSLTAQQKTEIAALGLNALNGRGISK